MIKEEIVLSQATHPARDQGQRPTCIAFALSELNLPHAPGIEALSPEYVYQGAARLTSGWTSGAGVALGIALQAASIGQPIETDFPYQATEPMAPVSAPSIGFTLYGAKMGRLSHDLGSITEALRNHQPVGLGIRLTRSFYEPTDGIVAFEQVTMSGTLHAVAVVGLGWKSETPYFLIRNSWGADWGVHGKAWLPGTYIREHAICAFGG